MAILTQICLLDRREQSISGWCGNPSPCLLSAFPQLPKFIETAEIFTISGSSRNEGRRHVLYLLSNVFISDRLYEC